MAVAQVHGPQGHPRVARKRAHARVPVVRVADEFHSHQPRAGDGGRGTQSLAQSLVIPPIGLEHPALEVAGLAREHAGRAGGHAVRVAVHVRAREVFVEAVVGPRPHALLLCHFFAHGFAVVQRVKEAREHARAWLSEEPHNRGHPEGAIIHAQVAAVEVAKVGLPALRGRRVGLEEAGRNHRRGGEGLGAACSEDQVEEASASLWHM
mmetsp:Transcript_14503/g.49088  ORF Transcript_14503/g.49088 Transcript_14503/m.49088 type:complete len:208 (-) Transcript_14503:132-755(-)